VCNIPTVVFAVALFHMDWQIKEMILVAVGN
jgi:hypothetical protein